MDFLCRDLAGYLAERLSIPFRPVIDVPWQERERLLDQGDIDLCWICGLPYVRKADQTPGKVEPLAAPVMAGSRYQDLPVYFSDVVVHRDSPFERLADLRGASWAYNEAAIRAALLDLLTRMDTDPQRQMILQKARMARFVPVSDRDYDPIRRTLAPP